MIRQHVDARRAHHSAILRALLLGGLILPGLIQAAEIYKWVDENGVLHFGDRPPPLAQATAESINPQLESAGVGPGGAPDAGLEVNEQGQTLARQRREAISQAQQETRLSQEQLNSACDHHRKELARFEPARRITYTNDDGEVVRLDDNQRLALIETSRGFIDQYCK
jgi:hypothetical protein